ncbi:MAG: response regulator [Byssovorax sp.]
MKTSAAGDPFPVAASHDRSRSTRPGAHAPIHVLVAEDDPVGRLLASRLLNRLGHTVVTAENGRLAVEAFGKERFDLVLMDMQMPEMSGIEAAMLIRASEAGTGRRVPIIALTANTKSNAVSQCLAAGMDAHISKPYRAPDLFEAIARLLPQAPPTAA